MRKNVFTSEFYNTKKIKMLAMKKDYFIKVLNPNKHVLNKKDAYPTSGADTRLYDLYYDNAPIGGISSGRKKMLLFLFL